MSRIVHPSVSRIAIVALTTAPPATLSEAEGCAQAWSSIVHPLVEAPPSAVDGQRGSASAPSGCRGPEGLAHAHEHEASGRERQTRDRQGGGT